jgi:hypothetical protein
MTYQLTFLMFLVTFITLFAQYEDTTEVESDNLIENIFEDSFNEQTESDLSEIIEDALFNPIDINKANIEQLTSIPFIDNTIATMIINHRKKFGNFISTDELYAIADLDKELVSKIIPFIRIYEVDSFDTSSTGYGDQESWFTNSFRKLNFKLRSRIGSDLQKREGYIKGKYLGSQIKSYNRLLIKYGSDLQAGITVEKDAGERSYSDYNSFHFSLKNYKAIKQLILGDYVIEFGQGLILWSQYSFSKGSDAILPVKRKARNLKPYTGATEYGFMRGSGISLNIHDFNLLLFYSSKRIDANIDSITNEIKSLPITGLHQTENESLMKNKAKETILGSRLEYFGLSSTKLGLSFYNLRFSHPLQKKSIYDYSGNQFTFYSFDFDGRIGVLNLFGEIANDQNSTAFYGGFIIAPTTKIKFATSLRSYPKNFINLHASGFGEQSGKTQNESGIYAGLNFISEIGLFNLYYDKFKFPYSTFENSVPSIGDEFYFSFRRKINRDLEFHLRFKTENKEVTETVGNLKIISERIRNSYRFEFDYFVSQNFKLRTRLEYNTYNVDKINLYDKGFLIYEDIKISPMKDLTLYGRIILFDTDSFNSAVYEYENDLTGIFSNLAMYGEGIRYYFIIKYKMFKNLTLSMKYAETYKPNERFLSSGNNRIIGNLDNRINFQIDANF